MCIGYVYYMCIILLYNTCATSQSYSIHAAAATTTFYQILEETGMKPVCGVTLMIVY